MSKTNRSLRRCVLFVGALALEELPAALESGADIVCIDLEDAVPPPRKDEARAKVFAALKERPAQAEPRIIVRINSLRSLCGLADVQQLLGEASALSGLLLPKVESGEEILWAASLVEEASQPVDLHAIIETPRAVEACRSIALAHPRLKALFFGGFDLSAALGCAPNWEPLLFARSRVVQAAAIAELDVLDSPFQDIGDSDGLRVSSEQAKALGMTGKTTKSRNQVDIIRDVFTPSAHEIRRAQEIWRAFELDPAKPLIVDGKLIELPTIKRIRRTAEFATA